MKAEGWSKSFQDREALISSFILHPSSLLLALGCAVADAFGQTLGVGEGFEGAQGLRVALDKDAIARVAAEGGCDDLVTQAQACEIQLAIDLRGQNAEGRVAL